jgi:hypothetical protein
MRLEIGNKVKWVSAADREFRLVGITAQVREGTVTNIVLDLNAAKQTIPWMIVEHTDGRKTKLCATDSYLKMMKVEVVDKEFV